jgi:hypothetical protein
MILVSREGEQTGRALVREERQAFYDGSFVEHAVYRIEIKKTPDGNLAGLSLASDSKRLLRV